MEIEHKIVCLPIDENQLAELQALEQQGYALIPGVPPVAVYHLARQKKPDNVDAGPKFRMAIDDSKIFVKKGG